MDDITILYILLGVFALFLLLALIGGQGSSKKKPEREKTGSYDGISIYADGCDFCDNAVTIRCLRTDHPRGEHHIARYCPICGKKLPDPHQSEPPS